MKEDEVDQTDELAVDTLIDEAGLVIIAGTYLLYMF